MVWGAQNKPEYAWAGNVEDSVRPTGNPKDITAQLAVALTGDGFTALTT